MEEANQFIILFGLKIFEPDTVITNIVLATFCFYFFRRTKRTATNRNINSWRLFFFFFGMSAALGGIAHAVHKQQGELFFTSFWMSMNLCSLVSAFFCFRATVFLTIRNEQKIKLINSLVLLWLGVFVTLTILFNHFKLTELNTGIFILYTLISHIFVWRKKLPGSGWIVFGFGISVLAILVHVLKISAHEFFNFKDISHVIMIVGLWGVYKGVKIMRGA